MMTYYVKVYLSALAAFLVIDMVWLLIVAREFYRKHLGFLLSGQPNWYAAAVFYLLFVGGVLVFAVEPGLKANSLRKSVLLGGFFGLITYATYDLTNLATVKNWPWMVTVVDMAWGTLLTAAVSCAGYLAGCWLR